MSIPPFKNWHWPSFQFYRCQGVGWQFFVDIQPDHNPILIVSRWQNSGLYIRAFERDIIGPKRS